MKNAWKCHCEESEGRRGNLKLENRDCFASLAMTNLGHYHFVRSSKKVIV